MEHDLSGFMDGDELPPECGVPRCRLTALPGGLCAHHCHRCPECNGVAVGLPYPSTRGFMYVGCEDGHVNRVKRPQWVKKRAKRMNVRGFY
jgi:hypothetical protein